MKRLRKFLFLLSLLLLLLFLVVLGGLFYLETDHAGRWITRKIDAAIPGSVDWEAFHFSLLAGEIEFTGFEIRDAQGERLLRLDRFFLDIAWRSLFGGNLTIAALHLEHPSIAFTIDAGGVSNFERALRAGTPGKEAERREPEPPPAPGRPALALPPLPLNVVVADARIVGGTVRYTTAVAPMTAMLDGIDLAIDANLRKKGANLTLRIGRGRVVQQEGISTDLSGFSLEARMVDGQLDPVTLDLESPALRLALRGHVHDLFTAPLPRLDLSIEATARTGEVRRALSLEAPLSGSVDVRLRVQGRPDDPDVALHVVHDGGEIAGYALEGAELDMALTQRRLSLNEFTVTAPAGRVSGKGTIRLDRAFPAGFLASRRDLEAIAYDFHLLAEGIALGRLLPGHAGRLDAEVALSGGGISPETMDAECSLDLSGAGIETPQLAAPLDLTLTTRARLAEGEAHLERFEARAGEVHLTAQGDLPLATRKVAATLRLDAPRLREPLALAGVSGVSGALSLRADLSGTLERPRLDLTLGGNALRFEETTIGDLALAALLDEKGTLRISRLALANHGSRIEGSGTVGLLGEGLALRPDPPIDMTIALHSVEAGDFVEPAPVSGILSGDLRISGRVSDPAATIVLRGRDLATPAATIGDLDATIDVAKGEAHIAGITLANGASHLAIRGEGRFMRPGTRTLLEDPTFTLDITSDALQIENFIETLAGRLTLDGHFAGRLRNPRGTLRVTGEGIDLGAQKIPGIRLSARLEGKRAILDALSVTLAPAEKIEAHGSFSFDQAYEIEIGTAGISLASIDPIRKGGIADGRLAFTFSGAGRLQDPHLSGELSLSELSVQGKPLHPVRLDIEVAEGNAHVRGDLGFDLGADYRLADGAFSARLTFQETDLAPYFALAAQQDLSGVLSGTVSARGNVRNPEDVVADVILSRLAVAFREEALLRSERFEVHYGGGRVTVPGIALSLLDSGKLELSGGADPKGPLDLAVSGEIPLEVASRFAEDLSDLHGALRLSATLSGTAKRPAIEGELRLEEIGLTIPENGQELEGVNGRILVTPTAVTIERIAGKLDTGRFDLTGNLALLEGFRPGAVRIDLRLESLPVVVPDTLDLLLESTLTFRGKPEETFLEGEVVLLEGLFYRKIDLGLTSGIGKKKRAAAPPAKPIEAPYLRNLHFDIGVRRRNPFIVDNNLAFLDIKPDLRVMGTLAQPVISGQARIESGTITYQKKEFVVERGIIDFVNPYEIEPKLDIESRVKIRSWQITLSIQGPPDALVFKLTSDPPLEDGDILSLLVIGRTTQELIAGEGGSTQSPAQLLAEMIATTFGEDIKKATGLDIFEVEGGGAGEDADRIEVTLGKKLTRRLTAKYAVESREGEVIQKAITEYKFLENLLLSASQDTKGIFGTQLLFRLEFR